MTKKYKDFEKYLRNALADFRNVNDDEMKGMFSLVVIYRPNQPSGEFDFAIVPTRMMDGIIQAGIKPGKYIQGNTLEEVSDELTERIERNET